MFKKWKGFTTDIRHPNNAQPKPPTESKAAKADGSPDLPPHEIHILEGDPFILLRNIETRSGLAVLFAPSR
jgi:hypothetical protein